MIFIHLNTGSPNLQQLELMAKCHAGSGEKDDASFDATLANYRLVRWRVHDIEGAKHSSAAFPQL